MLEENRPLEEVGDEFELWKRTEIKWVDGIESGERQRKQIEDLEPRYNTR